METITDFHSQAKIGFEGQKYHFLFVTITGMLAMARSHIPHNKPIVNGS